MFEYAQLPKEGFAPHKKFHKLVASHDNPIIMGMMEIILLFESMLLPASFLGNIGQAYLYLDPKICNKCTKVWTYIIILKNPNI